MKSRVLIGVFTLLVLVGCKREQTIQDYKVQIQKDPLFVDYMAFKKANNFTSSLNFPVAIGAEQKVKQARANGTLVSYYKSFKDVNGISWYDAVIVPRNKRLNKFSKVYYKYVTQMKLPLDFIKEAERQYVREHAAS